MLEGKAEPWRGRTQERGHKTPVTWTLPLPGSYITGGCGRWTLPADLTRWWHALPDSDQGLKVSIPPTPRIESISVVRGFGIQCAALQISMERLATAAPVVGAVMSRSTCDRSQHHSSACFAGSLSLVPASVHLYLADVLVALPLQEVDLLQELLFMVFQLPHRVPAVPLPQCPAVK